MFQFMVGTMLEGGPHRLEGLKFSLGNAMKDLRAYTHLTEGLGIPSPVGEAVHQSLVQANALGLGDKYIASLITAQEKLLGVTIDKYEVAAPGYESLKEVRLALFVALPQWTYWSPQYIFMEFSNMRARASAEAFSSLGARLSTRRCGSVASTSAGTSRDVKPSKPSPSGTPSVCM